MLMTYGALMLVTACGPTVNETTHPERTERMVSHCDELGEAMYILWRASLTRCGTDIPAITVAVTSIDGSIDTVSLEPADIDDCVQHTFLDSARSTAVRIDVPNGCTWSWSGEGPHFRGAPGDTTVFHVPIQGTAPSAPRSDPAVDPPAPR